MGATWPPDGASIACGLCVVCHSGPEETCCARVADHTRCLRPPLRLHSSIVSGRMGGGSKKKQHNGAQKHQQMTSPQRDPPATRNQETNGNHTTARQFFRLSWRVVCAKLAPSTPAVGPNPSRSYLRSGAGSGLVLGLARIMSGPLAPGHSQPGSSNTDQHLPPSPASAPQGLHPAGASPTLAILPPPHNPNSWHPLTSSPPSPTNPPTAAGGAGDRSSKEPMPLGLCRCAD